MSDFKDAARQKQAGMLSEFLYFLKTSKKWWLIPIVVILCQVANIELQLHCVIPRISTRLGANSIRSDPVARLVLPLPPPKSVLRL